MWPIIFSWRGFELRTLSIFVVIAVLASAFLLWRKAREEHYQESDVFDVFLWSSFWGVIWSRIGYIGLHFASFGISPLKWIDVFTYPGVSLTVGLVAMALIMYRSANERKWDAFELLDFWSIALANGLAWLSLGLWFDGTGFGSATTLPWGMVFQGVFDKHHPNQLYLLVFYFVLYLYLSKVEYRYRMFSWYRAGKNTAQTGFLISVFVLLVSLMHVALAFITPPLLVIMGIRVDLVVPILTTLWGANLLYQRSGRHWWQPGLKSS